MDLAQHCPECGATMKALKLVLGSDSAYLCGNGHFYSEPAMQRAVFPANPSAEAF